MRTDEHVKQDVVAELNDDIAINASQICVEVRDGVVTLSGQVGSYAEKWDAERAVQRVSRAGAQTTGADVDPRLSDDPGNAGMAQSANGVLKWMTALPMNSVKVVVEKDSITLSGEVDRRPSGPTIDTAQAPPAVEGDARSGQLNPGVVVAPAAEPSNEPGDGAYPEIRIVNNIMVNC